MEIEQPLKIADARKKYALDSGAGVCTLCPNPFDPPPLKRRSHNKMAIVSSDRLLAYDDALLRVQDEKVR